MARAIVSAKFQVVIPKDIREQTGLRKGQALQVISKGGVISLVPERPLSDLEGTCSERAAVRIPREAGAVPEAVRLTEGLPGVVFLSSKRT